MEDIFEINAGAEVETRILREKDNSKVYIIDNFYKYPEKVYEDMEKYDYVETNDYFPGKKKILSDIEVKSSNLEQGVRQNARSGIKYSKKAGIDDRRYDMLSINLLDTLLKKNIVPRQVLKDDAYDIYQNYQYADKSPEELKPAEIIPHIDSGLNDNIVVLIYMSKVESGGTGFYLHKKTGINYVTAPIEEKMIRIDLQETDEEKKEELRRKYKNYMRGSSEEYELLYLAKMKYNRAVIYKTRYFHSAYIEDISLFKEHRRYCQSFWVGNTAQDRYWLYENNIQVYTKTLDSAYCDRLRNKLAKKFSRMEKYFCEISANNIAEIFSKIFNFNSLSLDLNLTNGAGGIVMTKEMKEAQKAELIKNPQYSVDSSKSNLLEKSYIRNLALLYKCFIKKYYVLDCNGKNFPPVHNPHALEGGTKTHYFILFLENEGGVNIGGKEYDSEPGKVIIFPSSIEYTFSIKSCNREVYLCCGSIYNNL